MDAIQYASKHFVMLDELHDRVGERIASLLKCEAAMVSSGAASAMMLGTAGVLTGSDREKVGKLPKLDGMKNEVIIQKSHRFGYDHAVRACGVTLVEVETREEMEKAITDKTAMMLFYNNNNSVGKVRDAEFVADRQGARRADDERLRGGRAAGREPLEVHRDGVRPGDVLGREGHPRAAERRHAARTQGPRRRRAPERAAQRLDRPRPEGQQRGDARHAGRARAVPQEGLREGAQGLRRARRGDPQGGRRRARRDRRSVGAGSGQSRAAHPRVAARGQEGRGRGEGDARRRAVDRHPQRRRTARDEHLDDAPRRRQDRRQAPEAGARRQGCSWCETCRTASRHDDSGFSACLSLAQPAPQPAPPRPPMRRR